MPEVPAGPVVVPRLQTGKQGQLPDPAALRRVPVPDSAPPYEGDETGSPEALPRWSPVTPTQPAGPPPAGPADGSGPPRSAPESPARSGRATAGPGGWPSQFAQALAEALAGSRPAQQLTPWTTEHARKRIRQLGPLLATGQRPRVRRLMTSAPACDVLELTAVVGFGPRVRVLALRLERVEEPGEHWRCTEIESA